jgi:hypothetical protein
MSDLEVQLNSPSQNQVSLSEGDSSISKVKLSGQSQNKVVLNDTGKSVTLHAFRSVSSKLSDLSDVNLNGSPDGSVLVFDPNSSSYILRGVFIIDGETVTISGGEF